MDYNGLSIVSPQYYPDDEEWNDFFSLWYQDYNLNTDITEHFHYLISHSDYLVMVQRPLNNDDSDYEIISVSGEDQQSYLPAFTNIKGNNRLYRPSRTTRRLPGRNNGSIL